MTLPLKWAYALELEGHNGAEIIHVYISTAPALVTKPTDTPPSTTFKTGLIQPGNYSVSCFQGGKTYGKSSMGFGEIILDNYDGQYDYLLDVAFDGRPAVLRRIDPALMAAAAYPAGWTTVYTGSLKQFLPDLKGSREGTMSIAWRDRMVELQVPVPLAVYRGDNVLPAGLEGTADDLANQSKQLILGQVFEASMECCNTAKLIYAASPPTGGMLDLVADWWSVADIWSVADFFGVILAGVSSEDIITDWWSEPDIYALEDIFGMRRSGIANATVYVGGKEIPQEAFYADEADMLLNAPTAGYCRILSTYGYVRFGSTPTALPTISGTDASGVRHSIGSIMRSVFRDYMRWSAGSRYSLADLVRIDQQCPHPMGVVIKDSSDTVDQLLDRLCQSASVCYYFDAVGQVRAFQVRDPATQTADFVLSGLQIESMTRVDNEGIPYRGVRMLQQRCWTVQTNGLDASVTAARRSWIGREWRQNLSLNDATKAKHLLSEILEIETAFACDIQDEADREKDLRSVRRDFWEVVLKPQEFDFTTLRMGMIGNMQINGRYGYTAKNVLLCGITAVLSAEKITLLVWG